MVNILEKMYSGKAEGTCFILLAGRPSRRRLEEIIKKSGFKKAKNEDVDDAYRGKDATLVIRGKGSPVLDDYIGQDETGIAPNLKEILKLDIKYLLYLRRFCFNNHLPQDAVNLAKRLNKYFPEVVVLGEFPRGRVIYDSREEKPSTS
jgi:hypothetical protein